MAWGKSSKPTGISTTGPNGEHPSRYPVLTSPVVRVLVVRRSDVEPFARRNGHSRIPRSAKEVRPSEDCSIIRNSARTIFDI